MQITLDKLILADHLFDAVSGQTVRGYVGISGQRIAAVGRDSPPAELVSGASEVITFHDELVMPGLIDCHTFFTGYAVAHVGVDMTDETAGVASLSAFAATQPPDAVLFGHGWQPKQWERASAEAMLNRLFPERSIVIFAADRGSCLMSERAKTTFGFTGEAIYPELYYPLMRHYLNDRSFILPELRQYMAALNARGVTTVKEMGFDDFYGFTDILQELQDDPSLSLRLYFMSQPVGRPMDLPYARRMRDLFTGERIRFSGFNRMTDGTIASGKGDLKAPYEGTASTCSLSVDYADIQAAVLAADAEGFRYSLHAQGDAAVGHVADIFSLCQQDHGKLRNRHALTDMEFTDPADISRLGALGACCELYFQIMSLDSADTIRHNIRTTIGPERGKYYWNRRAMQDAGMHLSAATDLPLLFPSLPESLYYSCGGHLDDGSVFQRENTITAPEMLKAWTIGGAWNLGAEADLGTLEVGKLADIAVLDRDLTALPPADCLDAKVVMTIMDGQIVLEARA